MEIRKKQSIPKNNKRITIDQDLHVRELYTFNSYVKTGQLLFGENFMKDINDLSYDDAELLIDHTKLRLKKNTSIKFEIQDNLPMEELDMNRVTNNSYIKTSVQVTKPGSTKEFRDIKTGHIPFNRDLELQYSISENDPRLKLKGKLDNSKPIEVGKRGIRRGYPKTSSPYKSIWDENSL